MDPQPLRGPEDELKVEKIIQMMKITKKSDPLFKPLKKLKSALESIGYAQISLVPTKTLIVFHFGLGNQLDFEFIKKTNPPQQIKQSNPIIPGKSFCFLRLKHQKQAEQYVQNSFKRIIGDLPAYFNQIENQNLKRVLISLFVKEKQINNFQEVVQMEDTPEKYMEGSIPGLFVIDNFISKEEEMQLILTIDNQQWSKLNNRRVQHYGYEFKYGRNQIDKEQKYESPMPQFIGSILKKLQKLGFEHSFDQMTINDYFSGDGIPPHFDTHSPFEEKFVAISLLSGLAMDWKRYDGTEKSVYLPPRSLIIFSGQSRYAWTHGISCRKLDKINGQLRHRSRRVSITLRKIKYDKCSCPYYFFCDSQGYDQTTMKKSNPLLQKYIAQNINRIKLESKSATQIYNKYVCEAYQGFGLDFHNKAIQGVQKLIDDCFTENMNNYIQILDVGCGNGEYKGVIQKKYSQNQYHYIGTQICEKMKSFEDKVLMDGLNLAFKEGSFDIVLCVAVLHHMTSLQQRVKMMKQLRKVVSDKGAIILSVFGHKQKQNIYKDQDILLQYCVPHSKKIFPNENFDVRVDKRGYIYERYYHLFKAQELEKICNISGLEIKSIQEDKQNIIILLSKIMK